MNSPILKHRRLTPTRQPKASRLHSSRIPLKRLSSLPSPTTRRHQSKQSNALNNINILLRSSKPTQRTITFNPPSRTTILHKLNTIKISHRNIRRRRPHSLTPRLRTRIISSHKHRLKHQRRHLPHRRLPTNTTIHNMNMLQRIPKLSTRSTFRLHRHIR